MSDNKMILQNVRCSYVFVSSPNNKGTYGIQPLIPKDHPQLKQIKSIIKRVLIEKFGKEAWEKQKRYKLPLRDGSEERDEEHYQDHYFMNCNNPGKKGRPGIVNRKGEPADQDDIEEGCYSGAYFHVSISFFAFEPAKGEDGRPGVGVFLNNVMMRKGGERLDGAVSAETDFAQYADSSDDIDDFDDDIDF